MLSPMEKKRCWVLRIMQLNFGNWYIMRNLWTHSLMWNMSFGMHGHANFTLKWSKCRFCTQQCNAMKNYAMFMTFFPLLGILILFSFFFFYLCEETQINYLFLKDMITHATSSYLLQISSGTSLECMFWFNHLTFLGDGSGAVWHLINQFKYWS